LRPVQVVGQRGDGLAAALVSVFERFVPDFRRVVAIDSDSPHLPLAIVESAFERLEAHTVWTTRRRYYLVGASAMHRASSTRRRSHPERQGRAARKRARARIVGRVHRAVYDVDLPRPAPARRRVGIERRERLSPPRCSRRGDDRPKAMRAGRGSGWARRGRFSLFALGLIRPDEGTALFFGLLALAAVACSRRCARSRTACAPPARPDRVAALALTWRIPMLLAPPEPGATCAATSGRPRVRAGLSPGRWFLRPAFAYLRTGESWP